MAIDTSDRLTIEECMDYEEASGILGYGYHEIRRAVDMGVFHSIKFPHNRKKYLPRWEVDAVQGRPIASRATKKYLDELRHERMTADDKEYNIDGTPEWMPQEQIDHLVEEQRKQSEMLAQQEVLVGRILDYFERKQQIIDNFIPKEILEQIEAEKESNPEEYHRHKEQVSSILRTLMFGK